MTDDGMDDGVPGAVPADFGADPLAKIRWAMDQLERMTRADAARDAERAAKTADSARRGELGSAWQRVQERVDRGETTLTDVFTGRDDSPEAATLVRASRQNMSELLKTVREQKTDDLDEAVEGLADVRTRMSVSLGETLPGREPGGPVWP